MKQNCNNLGQSTVCTLGVLVRLMTPFRMNMSAYTSLVGALLSIQRGLGGLVNLRHKAFHGASSTIESASGCVRCSCWIKGRVQGACAATLLFPAICGEDGVSIPRSESPPPEVSTTEKALTELDRINLPIDDPEDLLMLRLPFVSLRPPNLADPASRRRASNRFYCPHGAWG